MHRRTIEIESHQIKELLRNYLIDTVGIGPIKVAELSFKWTITEVPVYDCRNEENGKEEQVTCTATYYK